MSIVIKHKKTYLVKSARSRFHALCMAVNYV